MPVDLAPNTDPEGLLPDGPAPSILKNRSFVALWIGQFIAFLGNSVYSLALMWEMKVLTGSTVMMSAVSVASLVPFLVLGPISGVLVDRWPKRKAMLWSDIIRACTIGVLTVLLLGHHITPWMLIVGAVLNSLVGSVYGPANGALIPRLVGRENLTQANSASQTGTVITQIIGPFAGGFLVAHVSMSAAFLANAIGYLASVISLLLIRYEEPKREVHPLDAKQMLLEMKEGFDVVRSITVMRKIIPISLIANFLFGPFDLILIQYCTVVLHGGAQLFGTLGSFFSVGMLLGGLLTGVLAKKLKKGIIVAISFPASAVAMLGMSFTRTIWVALTLAALFGLFNMIINVLFMTIIQSSVPDDKLGRVFGSIGLLIQGAQPFSQAIGGYLLAIMSVPTIMTSIGVLVTALSAYTSSLREVRAIE